MKTMSHLSGMILRVLFASTVLACGGIAGAQEANVRAALAETGDVWAGQRVVLAVDLLAPGYFSGAPAFALPDVPGLLLAPPEGSPTVSSETADDGTAYTVQRHEVSVMARRGGEVEIPAFKIRFNYKRQPLDTDVLPAEVTTPPVKFTVKVPPGAEKLGGVISARGLEVKEEWQPDPARTGTKAGDAFTRTITFTAPDVPAMAFPPFPAGKIDGIGIYQKDPEVLDRVDRGSLTGERHDTLTYVCQRPGDFTIPAARITWFDLESKTLKTIDFPEHKLVVAPNPAMVTQTAAEGPAAAKHAVWKGIAIALSAVLAGAAVWLFRNRLIETAERWTRPWRPVRLQPLNPGDRQG